MIKQIFTNLLNLQSQFVDGFETSVYVKKFINMCVKSIEVLHKRNSDTDKHMNFFNALGALLNYRSERVCRDEIECVLCENESGRVDFTTLIIE